MVLKIAREPISLETPVGEEDDSSLSDFIEDTAAVNPQEAMIHSSLAEQAEDHVVAHHAPALAHAQERWPPNILFLRPLPKPGHHLPPLRPRQHLLLLGLRQDRPA